MAAKILFLLAFVAAVAYAADSECNCEPPSELENTALWEFFKKLQTTELAEPEDNESRLDAVLAGELSPLLECNCLEKTENARRKRKVLPESADESSESDYSDESLDGRRTPKCPHGYVWFGILCVDERLVMDK